MSNLSHKWDEAHHRFVIHGGRRTVYVIKPKNRRHEWQVSVPSYDNKIFSIIPMVSEGRGSTKKIALGVAYALAKRE